MRSTASTRPPRPAHAGWARRWACRRGVRLAVAAAVVLAAPAASSAVPAHAATSTTSSSSGALAWAPPALSDLITLVVPDDGQVTGLDKTRDYQLVCTTTVHGTLHIDGGHDVVLVGCTVDAGTGRDAELQGSTGVVHLQGIAFVSTTASEGIDLAEPQSATVQLEDIWLGQVNGSRSSNHADLVQTWAGPGTLRIDRLVGWTTYQGLFFEPGQFAAVQGPWNFDLRHVAVVDADGHSAYVLWTPALGGAFHLALDDVVSVRTGSKAVLSQTTWAGSTKGAITGVQIAPSAPNPLSAVPGAGYTPPGYTS